MSNTTPTDNKGIDNHGTDEGVDLTEGFSADDVLNLKSDRVARNPFRMRFNPPDVHNDTDPLGEFRSGRIEYILYGGKPNRDGGLDIMIAFETGDKEVVSAKTFFERVRANDHHGSKSGISNRFQDEKSKGIHWDQGKKVKVQIAGVDDEHPAYEYIIADYGRAQGRRRGNPRDYTQVELPARFIKEALETFKVVQRGRWNVQALNLVTENAGESDQRQIATRLLVCIDPLFKEGADGTRKAENGVERKGVMALLDDARYSELEWQITSIELRLTVVARLFTNYPFVADNAEPKVLAEALDGFAKKVWRLMKFINNTGTPIGGRHLVALIGSMPNMLLPEHYEAEVSACEAIIDDPTKKEKEKDLAHRTVQNIVTAVGGTYQWLKGRVDKKRNEDARRLGGKGNGKKELPEGKPPTDAADAPPVVQADPPAADAPVETKTDVPPVVATEVEAATHEG